MKDKEIQQVEDLAEAASQLRRNLKEWETAQTAPSCNKKGLGINTDSRFSGVKMEISIDSWKGYYGSSSCGTVFSFSHPELFKVAFRAVLNRKLLALLEDTAQIMEADVKEIREKYVEQLKRRIANVEAIK